MKTVRDFASARSGDKGNHANIGVVAHNASAFEFLQQHLTADKVQNYFANWGVTTTVRYELPNIQAFNFMLDNALAGGASCSLRIDTQGKLLGTLLLDLPLEDNPLEPRA
jgi:hypothetical protein